VTTTELVYVLGIITGLIAGTPVFYVWGYRSGHLDGYQDHRAEVTDRANDADARRLPGAELEPIRSKTAPLPPWYDLHPRAPIIPGGGRPFPRASSRVATTASDIGPVFIPATDQTRIPMRPQPARDSGPGTEAIRRIETTGEMKIVTDELIAQMEAGTWP
jgi:hypothetical protein